MTQNKSSGSSTKIIIGCAVIAILLLLCTCIGSVVLVTSGALDPLTNSITTPIASSSSASSSMTSFSSAASSSSIASPGARIISQVVMARDVKGATFDPVGISDTFGPEQSVYHAVVTLTNAPANTSVKATWIAIDTGGVAAPNTNMGEYAITAEGSRNIDFSFEPNAGKLPPGKYRVDISVNGKADRSINFSVTATSASSSASTKATSSAASSSSSSTGSILAKLPTASASSKASSTSVSTKASSSAATKSTGLIASVTMAEGTQSNTKDPINPTTVFKPTGTFHAVVRTNNAPADTTYTVEWYAVDVGNAAPPNTLIDSTDLDTSGTRNIDFLINPPSSGWPVGTYRVEVSVNYILDTIKIFSVK